VPYAEAAKARGTKVYHLNIGQPDIPTPVVALESVWHEPARIIEYTHSAGNESYRRKLAETYYKGVGIEIDPKDIIVTVGGSEGLLIAMTVCMDAGDEALVPEPFYANYNGFAAESGIILKPINSTIETDFALPPIEEFERYITPRTKAILICNPNNPTGYLYSREELEVLRDLVKKYDLFLFCDEVYREFCYDGAVHHSVLNLEGIEQNVVMIDSVSKRYSMCGARIGTIISRNREVTAAALRVGQARLCPPFYEQIAAEAAVDTPKSYFEQVHQEYTDRRNYIVNALNEIPGVHCPMPRGAFYAMVRLPIDDCDRFARWMLEEFSYQGQTVMVAPGTGFYANPALGKDEVRIAYVLKVDDLKNAVTCLREGLKAYPGRTNL
jgi:aspartate aminotransferase